MTIREQFHKIVGPTYEGGLLSMDQTGAVKALFLDMPDYISVESDGQQTFYFAYRADEDTAIAMTVNEEVGMGFDASAGTWATMTAEV